MKKKEFSKFLAVAATTLAVTSIGAAEEVLASTTTEGDVATTAPQQAKVSVFNMYSDPETLNAYNEKFKVDNPTVTSNSGSYRGTSLSHLFDGDRTTHWETNRSNSDTYKNELTFTFDTVTELNRIVYAPRTTGAAGKGFPLEFEIQGNTEDGGEFEVIATGSYNGSRSDVIEIEIDPTQFKQLKFVFTNAYQGWASASEIMFYKEDALSEIVPNLFTNGLMNELKPEYQSLDKINAMELEIATHPNKLFLQHYIDSAKDVLNEQVDNTAIVTASQRGNANAMAKKYQIARTSFSLESFGRYVTPGETVKVFVDADQNGVMPTLVFGQIADDRNGWHRKYTLKPGLNIITAPDYSNMRPAAIYIENGALPAEQAYAPKVRLEGGTKFPVYYHGITDPAEFEKELEAYVANVSFNDDDFANGKPANGKVYNIAELVSENNTISTSAAGALKGIQELKPIGKTVKDTMDEWEQMWVEFQKLSGNFEVDTDPTKFFTAKFTSRVFTKGPYGWSDWGYTGYNGGNTEKRDSGFFKQIVKPFSAPGNDGWAYYHEWGHNINNSAMEHVEVTNNIYSVVMRKVFQNSNADRVDWNALYKRFSGEPVKQGFWTSLGIIMQVQYYYGQDTYGKATQLSIQNPDGIFDGLNKQQRMVVAFSLATDTDLTGFFNDWGYTASTEAMKEKVKHLPEPAVKLKYMNTLGSDYEGPGFSEDAEVKVNSLAVNAEDNTINLSFDIDEANKDASMGYEILRNGEVVGYTTNTSFVDTNIDPNENYVYEVVAYDKKLNATKPTKVNSFKPTISTENSVTVKLYEQFDPLKYVKAFDYKGTDITDAVDVQSNVDVDKKGNYTVTYTVNNRGISETITMNVSVISDYHYLSDLQAQSHKIAWGGLKLDKAPEGSAITLLRGGTPIVYEKGIGAHANSEIVYDVEGQDYDFFESYIGIDQAMEGRPASATFEVWVDDEKVYTSKEFSSNTEREFVQIPIKNAKTVKLVTTDAAKNGNASDHTVWADAKFTRDDSKPVIEIEQTFTDIALNDHIDLLEGITAFDIEDGPLQVTVEDSGFTTATPGLHDIQYTVTDSDDNTVTATKQVYVYNATEYLSDVDWVSATTSWRTVQKDQSAEGHTLKLLVDGEQKEFAKGIGTHSNSEIVYNLEGQNYDYFLALVGVERNIGQNNRSSVTFKVLADDVEVFNSGLMKYDTEAKEVYIPVKGVKQLKLIVEDNGNQAADHAAWADAKFYTSFFK